MYQLNLGHVFDLGTKANPLENKEKMKKIREKDTPY
jgi:hypothetical protein